MDHEYGLIRSNNRYNDGYDEEMNSFNDSQKIPLKASEEWRSPFPQKYFMLSSPMHAPNKITHTFPKLL